MYPLSYRKFIFSLLGGIGLSGLSGVAVADELLVHKVPVFRIHVMELPESVVGMPLRELEKWAHAGDPAAETP